jgi:hypothetical protein
MKRLLIAAAAIGALCSGYAVATELSPLLGTMNADNVTLYPGLATYPNGGFHPMGVIYSLAAPVATGSGTGAQTLGTYSLPANALDTAGRRLRITAMFATASNTNNKTCTLNFGSESISTGTMASSAETATAKINVVKTSSSHQTVWSNGVVATTPTAAAVTAATETDTAAIAITAICTDGSNSAGDATLEDMFVEYMN